MRTLVLLAAIACAGAALAYDQPVAAPQPKYGCARAESRQFDFWIGDWKVTNPQGKLAGHNRIDAILDGCALAEHWDGAGGSHGVSYNAYDPEARVWRQFWVDNQGSVLRLEGGLDHGLMVLRGNSLSTAGKPQLQRITWSPNADGSVRQLWDQSDDAGKTWTVALNCTIILF